MGRTPKSGSAATTAPGNGPAQAPPSPDERLRDSELRNRAILEAIPDLLFVLSKDGYYLDFKAEHNDRLALPPEKVIGSHINQTGFSDDHLAQFGEAIARAIETGNLQSIYYDLATPKGPGQWEARMARLDDQRVLTIVRDVTEQRRSEQALRESQERLQKILEVLPFGVWLIDATGQITYGNSEAIALWGGARYLKPEDFDQYKAWWPGTGRRISADEWAVARVVQDGYPVLNEEIEIESFTGVRKFILNSAVPIRDSKGALECIVCVNFDITTQKRAEEHRSRLEAQILQAQKLESLGVLAGGIAHDFNNLLVGILGNADLALSELPASTPARHYLDDLKKAAIRASELTNQMLAYSGKGRFVVEAISINDLVQEMSHLLKVSISKRAVLKYNFFENLPLIEADPTQVRQVVMNLIINASDAIGDRSGVISLSTGVMEMNEELLAKCQVRDRPEPGYFAFIEVADTGCGMDDATIKRIFDPFFTTKFTGRGLGLAAVMGIARGHKGAIRVQSEPGKGSTFTVLFPCSRHALEARVNRERPGGKTLRGEGLVLVVDDEESVRNIAKMMLERHGFKVITARDGREGIKVFEAYADQVAAVVLDMTMPHMGGEETFQRLRALRPDVRIVLASGYTEQEATARFLGKGLAGFIQKPFQLAGFVQKICQVIAPKPPAPESGT
jgi:two-component system cell cycle sensor histidine kinase/response regulator CckA